MFLYLSCLMSSPFVLNLPFGSTFILLYEMLSGSSLQASSDLLSMTQLGKIKVIWIPSSSHSTSHRLWDLYSSLRVETKDIIELSTNRWSLQVATILDHLRWNKCFSCFFIIENLISLHCWQLTRQNEQSEDVASGSAKLCWAVSIIFLFFWGGAQTFSFRGPDLWLNGGPQSKSKQLLHC